MFQNVDFISQVWWGQKVKRARSLKRSSITIPRERTHQATPYHRAGTQGPTTWARRKKEGGESMGQRFCCGFYQINKAAPAGQLAGFNYFSGLWSREGCLEPEPGRWRQVERKGSGAAQLCEEVIPSRALDGLLRIWKVDRLLSPKLASPWGSLCPGQGGP